jgi:hypothetical protein
MPGICAYQGFGESLTSLLCNAGTGNLSASDVAAIKAQTEADVRRASAGIQPTAQNVLVQRALAEVDQAIASFGLPGESGQDLGAAPGGALRVPGTGVLSLSKLSDILPSLPNLTNLKWYVLGVGILVGAFFAFPYIAPGLARNLKAARHLRG